MFVKIVLEHHSNLKQHAMVGEWLICRERGIPQSSNNKAVEIPENDVAIVPNKMTMWQQGMTGMSILARCLRLLILMLKSHFAKIMGLY